MQTWLRTLLAAVGGVALGVLAGWAQHGAHTAPPVLRTALRGVEDLEEPRPQPLFVDPTATAAAAPQRTRPLAATAAESTAGVVPSAPVDNLLHIPHGRGHYADLMIAEAGWSHVDVHLGAMARNGSDHADSVAGAPVVGRLRGPVARVELLHLGFDEDAHLTAAHIRSAADGVEGIVLLRTRDSKGAVSEVAVRPVEVAIDDDNGAAPAEPE